MYIIIAGTDARNNQKSCQELKMAKLYSILDSKKDIKEWDDENHLLMVDSGAHSYNKETITPVGYKARAKLPNVDVFARDYLKFIGRNRMRKMIFVEFDVYGHLGIQALDDAYKRIQDLGGACKYIRVYHPVLDGGSLDVLRQWVEEGQDYIGIGNDSTDILDDIFLITKDKVKLHGFAMTKLDLLHRYPFFSADSTTPLSTIIFGKYTKPIMNYYNKEEILKMKSVWAYQEDEERLYNAILECKKTQAYFTELWELRGIKWNHKLF